MEVSSPRESPLCIAEVHPILPSECSRRNHIVPERTRVFPKELEYPRRNHITYLGASPPHPIHQYSSDNINTPHVHVKYNDRYICTYMHNFHIHKFHIHSFHRFTETENFLHCRCDVTYLESELLNLCCEILFTQGTTDVSLVFSQSYIFFLVTKRIILYKSIL